MATYWGHVLTVGDHWLIWMTGNVKRFEAVVEQADPPRLRLVNDLYPHVLKDGDFVLIRKLEL